MVRVSVTIDCSRLIVCIAGGEACSRVGGGDWGLKGYASKVLLTVLIIIAFAGGLNELLARTSGSDDGRGEACLCDSHSHWNNVGSRDSLDRVSTTFAYVGRPMPYRSCSHATSDRTSNSDCSWSGCNRHCSCRAHRYSRCGGGGSSYLT